MASPSPQTPPDRPQAPLSPLQYFTTNPHDLAVNQSPEINVNRQHLIGLPGIMAVTRCCPSINTI